MSERPGPSVRRDPKPLPEGFRFGVATAGFQVEGGYNGPGEPANNWLDWERSGRVEPSGLALDFWNRYEEHLDRARAIGLDGFRLSVEWARCEPRPGEIDDRAFERYRAILDACRERGLEPLVSLHHFTHPAWLGEDFWLDRDAPERFAEWAALVAERLRGRCSAFVTINELNVLPVQSYLTGVFPPGRRFDLRSTVRALDHLLTAHVLAYAAVHERVPGATVSTNNYVLSLYELDRMLTDVLEARSAGIGRYELRAYLAEQRRRHEESQLRPGGGAALLLERALARFTSSSLRLDQALPRAVAAVYESRHPRTLDVVQVDYYDPVAADHVRLPGHRSSGGRRLGVDRALWDQRVDPSGLARVLADAAASGSEVWVVENGLCNRVRRGRSFPRLDGWTRPRFLREHLAALAAALDAGVRVGAYFHWTLADNYEWGSYEPRFGLYGVDRERGLRWSERDAMGEDAAGAYRRLVQALRAGDRSALAPEPGTTAA